MLGWPFLVAPGRRRDHTTIMAPRVLVEQLDYGVLEEQARPGPPRTVEARSARGRRLFIAYWTEPVEDVRDEHGRPLRMIYGFACLDGSLAAVDEADRRAALAAVRSAYRAFLADEDRHTVEPSAPFTLHSPAAAVAAQPDRSSRSLPAWLVGASALVILAVVAGVALLLVRPSPAVDVAPSSPTSSPALSPSPACPSPSRSVSPSASASPASRIKFRRSPDSSGSPAPPAPSRSPCPG
jgi:hypothetical protein